MSNQVAQAHHQAPWRAQIQWIVTILVGVILAVVVAGFYLTVSAQTVSTGLTVQQLSLEKDDMQQRIANLRTQLAEATSLDYMMERAKELGFHTASFEEIEYIVVEDYAGRQTPLLAARKKLNELPKVELHPSYTASLSEWLFEKLVTFSSATGKQP